jgi:hypothetical protein
MSVLKYQKKDGFVDPVRGPASGVLPPTEKPKPHRRDDFAARLSRHATRYTAEKSGLW